MHLPLEEYTPPRDTTLTSRQGHGPSGTELTTSRGRSGPDRETNENRYLANYDAKHREVEDDDGQGNTMARNEAEFPRTQNTGGQLNRPYPRARRREDMKRAKTLQKEQVEIDLAEDLKKKRKIRRDVEEYEEYARSLPPEESNYRKRLR